MSQTRLAVLLFTDLVGSTELKSKIGTAAYARLLARHNELFETGLRECAGAEIVKHTGDGYFVTLPTASDAVRFALRLQTRMKLEPWRPQAIATRVGIHIGEVQLMDMAGRADVLGLSADIAARIMSLATGGQILLTASAFNDARQFVNASPEILQDTPPLKWIAHGPYLFKGSDEPLDVFEVGLENFSPLVRPPDSEKVKRVVPHDQEPTLGWRPAIGLEIPNRPGWKLERKLGDGGFGEVWLGVHGKLKHERRVFKFCFDVDRLRSFKRELTLFRLLREALGERDDIATLYEVQLNEPPFYLESEYTEGGNLLEWSDRKGGIDKIPLNERLERVAQIADAVAAAHSVGVLHKDIKPTNILIHENDGQVTPRLADFGIGILSDRSQLEARAITETGFTVLTQNDSSRTGTRMYSPPESLLNKPFTTQGDVYALGILLYQMVIGDLKRPLAPGWEREVADPILRDDIAAMVEGDPARRVSSALDVAQRIRTLQLRATERDRLRDLAQLLAARKRLARLAVTTASVLILIGIAAGTVTWLHIRRLKAEERKTAAALVQAQQQKAKAANQASIAEAVSTFLSGRVLTSVRAELIPDKAVRDTIVKVMLDPAAAGVAEDFKDKPLTEAAVRDALALCYDAIGRADLGLTHAQAALALRRGVLAEDDPNTLASVHNLALMLQGTGNLAEAERLYRDALEGRRRVLGNSDRKTLQSINDTANILHLQGKLAEAEPLCREAMQTSKFVLGPLDIDTLIAIGNVGNVILSQGKLNEAEPFLREALEGQRKTLTDESPTTLISMGNLAFLLEAKGDLVAAEALQREALEKLRKVLGDDDPRTMTSINNLGSVLEKQHKFDEAEPLWREALERRRRVLTNEHAETLASIGNLGYLYKVRGKMDQAEVLYREALQGYRRVLGDDNPDTLNAMNNLAFLLGVRARPNEAEPLWRELTTRAAASADLGPQHPNTKRYALEFAECLDALARHPEADAVRKQYDLAAPATRSATKRSTGSATVPATSAP